MFRKVMSTEDTIQDFAPALRMCEQAEALRISLQLLGDLCGFGIMDFDFDNAGYVKTATEVSSDNSALMCNIARHGHALEASLSYNHAGLGIPGQVVRRGRGHGQGERAGPRRCPKKETLPLTENNGSG